MKFNPHPYQQYAIDRIVSDHYLGLFQDMGLGKTVEVLTAIEELKFNRWEIRKPLVIAPKKVAEATWSVEAAKWDHLKHMRVIPIMGTAMQRIKAIEADGDLWVINRENVTWMVDHLRNSWDFDMVVLDESTSFKNSQSRRFQSLKRVRPKIHRLVELTGTPSPNGMEDLFAQIYLLDGGKRLGRTLTSFREAFMTQDYARPGQTFRTYSMKPGADAQIRARIADICVSMSAEDYLDLPDYVEDVIPVALDSAAQKAYQKLERDMLLEVDTDMITAGSAAALSGKLLQLCGGAVYSSAGEVIDVHSCKIEAFRELIEGLHDEHALVFYWYRHEQDRLTELLEKMGKKVRVYSGSADAEAWNAGDVDVLLAHPVSCGYGLNLQQGGRHAVWYTLPNWALEIYQQANKRLHRQGQKSTVITHILAVQGGMDEDVLSAIRAKGDTQTALIEALKARVRNGGCNGAEEKDR